MRICIKSNQNSLCIFMQKKDRSNRSANLAERRVRVRRNVIKNGRDCISLSTIYCGVSKFLETGLESVKSVLDISLKNKYLQQ